MAEESRRSELIAGGFVVAMLGAAIGGLALVSRSGGPSSGPSKLIEIAVPVDPGIRGLDVESAVQYGGLDVGKVRKLGFEGSLIIVTVSVPADLAVTDTARIAILTNPLSGGGVLDIRSLSDSVRPGGPLRDGDRLPPDRVQVTDVLMEDALRGLGLSDPAARDRILRRADLFVRRLENALTLVEKRLGDEGELTAALRNLQALSDPRAGELPSVLRSLEAELKAGGDLRRALIGVRELAEKLNRPEVGEKLDGALAAAKRLEAALAALETFADKAGKGEVPIVQRLQTLLDTAGGALGKLDEFLAANRGKLDAAIADAAAALADVRKLAAEITESRTRFAAGLLSLEKTVGVVREAVLANRPAVDAAVGDLRVAASELKVAVSEVRSAPWRLLLLNYDAKTLANAGVLDAARSFHRGAADVEDAVRLLTALTESGPVAGDAASAAEHKRKLDAAAASLKERLAKLAAAESLLFEKLK